MRTTTSSSSPTRARSTTSAATTFPDTKKQAKGLPIVNLIEIENGDRVTAILVVKDYSRDFILLATREGVIKKTKLNEFAEVRRNGKIAMHLEPTATSSSPLAWPPKAPRSSSSPAKARQSCSRSMTSARPAEPAAASAA
ncbi:DNA gyrase C-terminal beta-propeller domain-containing protein [Candidatus Amarobacter glycogenicus]|uniref:DNA gyrase C-terminal beta-propeller domain-containing protein n=1 Tax=Candidatus Amarobacter glycogenicus TaxID=3140699 RepID=UPI0031CC7D72